MNQVKNQLVIHMDFEPVIFLHKLCHDLKTEFTGFLKSLFCESVSIDDS